MKRLFSTGCSDHAFNFAMLVLRVGAGVLMIPHGYDKLVHFSKLSHTFYDPFHIGSATALVLTIFAEFFCACLLVMGLLTRFASIPLVIAMSVALFLANKGDFFGHGEAAALFLTCFITILFAGPGKMSMDRLIGK